MVKFHKEKLKFPRNPPNPPFIKGGQGGFLECVRGIAQN